MTLLSHLVYYLKKATPHQQFITARKNFNETVKLTNLLKNPLTFNFEDIFLKAYKQPFIIFKL